MCAAAVDRRAGGLSANDVTHSKEVDDEEEDITACSSAHRENQSAESVTINTVCKPKRLAGGFCVLEFAPISLTKPLRKERCCHDSSILFGKVL